LSADSAFFKLYWALMCYFRGYQGDFMRWDKLISHSVLTLSSLALLEYLFCGKRSAKGLLYHFPRPNWTWRHSRQDGVFNARTQWFAFAVWCGFVGGQYVHLYTQDGSDVTSNSDLENGIVLSPPSPIMRAIIYYFSSPNWTWRHSPLAGVLKARGYIAYTFWRNLGDGVRFHLTMPACREWRYSSIVFSSSQW